MAAAVFFDHVLKSFGTLHAVNHVTLRVEPGDLFFLLGPSGCGKTTLLRCLAGFYIPESGSIQIDGQDVTQLPPHQRDTGMVFQSYALWPHMTVAQNVSFGLEIRRLPRREIAQRVAEALAMVKMTDRADHKPNQLSGGQQQRVALARALVIRPKCLLLDEPLSNLDAKLRLEMRSEIRRICKESGLTAIYVTHDQKEALSIADQLAVMDAGRVQQIGQPREVYLHPASRFVANFIGETNFLEGTVLDVQPGRTEVQTALGLMLSTAPLSDKVAHGMKVTLSLRPEAIRLGPTAEGAVNVFDGTVHDTVYLGEVAQHRVSLAGENGNAKETVVLKAFELNPKYVARDAAREAAKVWVDPQDVVVLTN